MRKSIKRTIFLFSIILVFIFVITSCKNKNEKDTKEVYSITYIVNEGKLSSGAVISYDGSSDVLLPIPEREGYKFSGWYDNELLIGSAITSIARGTTGNKVYYAKWDEIIYTYSISYVLNDGQFTSGAITSYQTNTSMILPIPSREGYTFNGWFENEDFSGNQVTEIVKGESGDKTYYAKWIEIDFTYLITYVLDGGSFNGEVVSSYNGKTKITLPIPTKDGYSFEGWYESTYFTGTSVSEISIGEKGDKVFYAKWKYIPVYTITYVLDGGVLPTTAPTTYNGLSSLTLPTPTKTGYVFLGWYEDEQFMSSKVSAIKKGDSGNKIYYAKWIKDPSNYSSKWTFNTLGFDGSGMEIVIKVDQVKKYDPFDENYIGMDQEIKKKHLNLVNAAYNVKIKYAKWDNEAPWGPERINFIKTSFADGTFQKNNVYIVNIFSQWVPTLVKAGCFASLYNWKSDTGIFKDVLFDGQPYEQNQTINEVLGVKKQVYGYCYGSARPDYFLYYNATLAAQCGMEDPAELWFRGEWTWSTFDAWVKQAQTNLQIGQYAIDAGYAEFSIGTVAAQGSKMVNTASGVVMMAKNSVTSVFDKMKAFYQGGYWDKGHGVQNVSQNFLQGNNIFHSGMIDYLKESTRFNPDVIEFEIGVVPYPTADSGNTMTPITELYTYYDTERNKVKVNEPLTTRTGEVLKTKGGEPIYGLDLSNSTIQIPYTGCNNYSIMDYTNAANGITAKVLFEMLHDLECGMDTIYWSEGNIVSDQDYRKHLMKLLGNNIYVDVIMSVQDESLSYYEVMETLSMTVGGGSHFGPNAFWPLASGIMTKEDTPATVLKSVESIYQAALEEILQ